MTVNFSKLAIFPFFFLQLFHCYYISGYFTLLLFKENVWNVKCYIQWSQKSVKWWQDMVHVWSNRLHSSSPLFKIGTRDCCYSQGPNSSVNYPIMHNFLLTHNYNYWQHLKLSIWNILTASNFEVVSSLSSSKINTIHYQTTWPYSSNLKERPFWRQNEVLMTMHFEGEMMMSYQFLGS